MTAASSDTSVGHRWGVVGGCGKTAKPPTYFAKM